MGVDPKNLRFERRGPPGDLKAALDLLEKSDSQARATLLSCLGLLALLVYVYAALDAHEARHPEKAQENAFFSFWEALRWE